MERLRPGWFLEGLFDAEYQHYRLLAYLNKVRQAFFAQRLYPPLSDIIAAYAEVLRLSAELEQAPRSDPSSDLHTLEEIITFSIPKLYAAIEEGRSLYETIAQALQAHVIGVIPLYRDEGYVLLRRGTEPIVRVYTYEMRRLYNADEEHIAIRMSFLQEYPYNAFSLGFLRVRERLLREHAELPVPYMLVVESPWVLPIEETLLPIIQRSLPRWTKETPPSTLA